MEYAEPLPDFLVQRHRERRARLTEEEHARREMLSLRGQTPQAMIIACCDSRLTIDDVFGAGVGDFFVHRNIANLVPPYADDGLQHGTSATIEFAVNTLKVRHLMVIGHSSCGGIASCLERDLRAATGSREGGFVGTWLDILASDVAAVAARGLDRDRALHVLEHEAVLASLRNLMTFPFVSSAVSAGDLHLHGAWRDIGDATMEYYDRASGGFVPV